MIQNKISTHQKKVQTDSDNLLKYFLENYNQAGNGVDFIYDLDQNKCLHISKNFSSLAGHNCPEKYNDCIFFLKSLIHPLDYSHFLSEMLEFIRAEKINQKATPEELIKSFTLNILHRKGNWIKVDFNAMILSPNKIIGIIRKSTESEGLDEIFENISPREIEILTHIANGDSAKIIGNKLNISPNTVITHRKNLKQKFNVKNTAELIKRAIKSKII